MFSRDRRDGLDGVAGVIHSIVMFITFPFRKWWLILALVVILAALPFLFGVTVDNFAGWYKEKLHYDEIVEVIKNTKSSFVTKKQAMQNSLHELLPSVPAAQQPKQQTEKKVKKDKEFVSWNVAKFRHAKYKEQPKAKAVKVQAEAVENTDFKKWEIEQQKKKVTAANPVKNTVIKAKENAYVKNAAKEKKELFSDIGLEKYYVKKENLPLEYVSEPEQLFGYAEIIDANSLQIDERFVYLYGIYSDPSEYDTAAAERYLHDIADGKKIDCKVVAYTHSTNSATALCFVGGDFINRLLVDKNLAKNVALR
jgi:hypothetical protein